MNTESGYRLATKSKGGYQESVRRAEERCDNFTAENIVDLCVPLARMFRLVNHDVAVAQAA